MATPPTGRPRGRPRIQEAADRVVASVLAEAGARIDSSAWSSRALAERTGLSQTAVARAVRRLAGEAVGGGAVGGAAASGGTGGARTMRIARFVIGLEPRAVQEGPVGLVCQVDFQPVSTLGHARSSVPEGAPGEGRMPPSEHGPVPLPERSSVRSPARHQRRRAAVLGALLTAGVRVPEELPGQLADCAEVPVELLEALSAHVAAGETEFLWSARNVDPLSDSQNFDVGDGVQGRARTAEPAGGRSPGTGDRAAAGRPGCTAGHRASAAEAGASVAGAERAPDARPGGGDGRGGDTARDDHDRRDSHDRHDSHAGIGGDVTRGRGGRGPARVARQRTWLPRAGTSATEQLAVRLRDAIIDTGLRPGDRLSAARTAAMLEVPRAQAAEVLRRMVDDEILDGSAGDVRIPAASADDVIELYAARMLLGDVLLRAAAHRPRRYLLPVRRALDAVAQGAASGAHVDDADLRFQQEWARASGLEQTVRLFESSTVRVRMLIAVLRLDYARTATSILRDDRAILTALASGDAPAAVRAWHRKIDAAVRHMHGRARNTAFDVELWGRLTGL
jgi:DNA-binding GntR family transcriptional regulator